MKQSQKFAETSVLIIGCSTGYGLASRIGAAKRHLEQTAQKLNSKLASELGGSAFISVNKGVVTRSSAVIPVISLYLSVLFKIMKEKGIHEGCIADFYAVNGWEVSVKYFFFIYMI